MIPVYQTRTVVNDGSGNCFNACVASILELPLRDVAQVLPTFKGNYWGEWERWANERGVQITYWPLGEAPPKGFAIATGYGGRVYPDDHEKAGEEILHAAVVFNGKVIHDPFPGAETFDRIQHYWTIDPIEQAEAA